MMIPGKLYSKNYFKVLSILHLALMAGMMLFGLVITLLIVIVKFRTIDTELSNVFNYVIPAIVIAGVIASNIIFKNKLSKIPDESGLGTKMENYRAALIVRYALLEGPAIFTIIVSFITGNITFLIYTGILVLLMLYARPSAQKAISDLGLDDQEKIIVEDPEGVIE